MHRRSEVLPLDPAYIPGRRAAAATVIKLGLFIDSLLAALAWKRLNGVTGATL